MDNFKSSRNGQDEWDAGGHSVVLWAHGTAIPLSKPRKNGVNLALRKRVADLGGKRYNRESLCTVSHRPAVGTNHRIARNWRRVMNDETPDGIIDEYSKRHDQCMDFTQSLETLIRTLLRAHHIEVHSVSSRLKARHSLEAKLNRPDAHYTCLKEVTDIVGIRIITFFADDVDEVAQVIEREFDIDEANSVDKRASLDPDRFGYLSVHYVLSLPGKRLELEEYKRFDGCLAEIQVRSILQHAWAEMEHDLGYKSDQAVPRDIRRGFARLAGLLEIADREFVTIRDDLNQYEASLTERIAKLPSAVLLDQASLHTAIEKSKVIMEVDAKVASQAQMELRGGFTVSSIVIAKLAYFGFKTIEDVETSLTTHADDVVRFSSDFLPSKSGSKLLVPGVSLLYLTFLLAAKSGSQDKVEEFFRQTALPEDRDLDARAQRVMKTWRKLFGSP